MTTRTSTVDKNTVKPVLTAKPRKRGKRSVENDAFSAFVRRILAAYARRVAAGDIEALPSLSLLACEVDAAMRQAVTGLRTFGYTWADIAARLGVSRQAVQMRYGDPAERGALDRRMLTAGMAVTLATLVEVFADHHPGSPMPATCPGCGYCYAEGESDCPTLATVRPLLYRRRHEDPAMLGRLSGDQHADLVKHKTRKPAPAAAARGARTPVLFTPGGGR